MQNSQLPAKWYKPFAVDDAAKVEIPVTTPDPTRASQSAGFPPLTMQPPESGGVPPQGEDFNGAMNQVARIVWWHLAGGALPFDNAWTTDANIGGYPQGATINAADLRGEWISTADNNTNNPDTNGTSWVPGYAYGSATVGTVGVNLATAVTLTPAQAAKGIIFVQGNLTAATVLTFPAWVKNWIVVNNTGTGAFTLTVKTAAGVGVVVNRGDILPLLCDGTNMAVAQRTQSANIARFESNSSLTVPPGVTTMWMSGTGGGGGGGAGAAGGASAYTGAGGGSGGAGAHIIRVPLTVVPGTVLGITIGAGGVGGAGGAGAGATGTAGTSTIVTGFVAGTVTLSGGTPGQGGNQSNVSSSSGGTAGTGGNPTTAGQSGASGSKGSDVGSYTNNVPGGNGAPGASGPFGGGGGGGSGASAFTGSQSGLPGSGYGTGGGGGGGIWAQNAGVQNGGSAGNGAPGFVLLEW